jgi:hypothetical protein
VDQANTIAIATDGAVSATLATGALSSFADLATGDRDVITITVNDEASVTMGAAALAVLGGKTTGTVTVTNAVTISGTTAQLIAALVTGNTKVVAASANVTFTDAPTLTQFAAIDAAVGGTLNYTSIADTLSALVTDAGNGVNAVAYNKRITVTDSGTVQAVNLTIVSANTTETVTATAATTLSGSAAALILVVQDTGIATATNYNAVISGTASVAQINQIDGDTTGTISVEDIADSLANIANLNVTSPSIIENATGTVTANGGSSDDSADFSAVMNEMIINGGAGADSLSGTNFADVISGGTNLDALFGGLGADVFAYATGDAPTAAAASLRYEKISDFNPEFDMIDRSGIGAPFAHRAEADVSATIGGTAGTVSIDAAGKVTFGGNLANASMTELLAAVRSIVTEQGEVAFFEFDDGVNGIGTFIYQENGTSANDMLIFLSGVTGLVDFSNTRQDADTFWLG